MTSPMRSPLEMGNIRSTFFKTFTYLAASSIYYATVQHTKYVIAASIVQQRTTDINYLRD